MPRSKLGDQMAKNYLLGAISMLRAKSSNSQTTMEKPVLSSKCQRIPKTRSWLFRFRPISVGARVLCRSQVVILLKSYKKMTFLLNSFQKCQRILSRIYQIKFTLRLRAQMVCQLSFKGLRFKIRISQLSILEGQNL